jgi:hypothetical protein
MALTIKRDADNKWYTYIDWTAWVAKQALTTPNGPGLTVTVDSASWAIPAALVEESETQVIGSIAFFVGSSGANDTSYPLTCTITYSATELSATDLTQDRTITVILEDQ